MKPMNREIDLAARAVDPGLLEDALSIVERLREHGREAYFAGGAVRDLLLGRPVSDIDIATSARPDEVESLFEKTVPLGRQFGVVVVVLDSRNYEVTTFREESDYQDGRHPSQVRFSNLRTDARRRDFTVNALFLDPLTGAVLDYVEGRKDLESRLIRTVGNPSERFREDKLRVLRGVRFACQLDFRIDETTWKEIRSFAPELLRVSWERIRDELLRILTASGAAHGLDLLVDSGILEVILPEVSAMVGVEQPPEFHPEGDVFTHTRLMFDIAREEGEALDETQALAVLLHDVGKPPTFEVRDRIRFNGHAEVGARMSEEICRRLRMSGEQTERVVDLVGNHLRFIHVQEMRESTLKRFLRMPDFERHLRLHRLDCLASHGDLSSYLFCREKLRELRQEDMRPGPLLGGRDLIALGFRPGPIFSEILRKLEDQQLERKITTREEALEWVRRNFSSDD